jgi:hypothetical protein
MPFANGAGLDSAAAEREARKVLGTGNAKSSKPKPDELQAPRPTAVLAVYSGQTRVGWLEDRARGQVLAFRVVSGRGELIGQFQNRTDAMRAIVEARGAS